MFLGCFFLELTHYMVRSPSPGLDLRACNFCCHCPETPNNFLTRSPMLSFCTWSRKLCSLSCPNHLDRLSSHTAASITSQPRGWVTLDIQPIWAFKWWQFLNRTAWETPHENCPAKSSQPLEQWEIIVF